MQACKIIDFLISFIDFKKNFLMGDSAVSGMYSRDNLNRMSEGIDKKIGS
jgi:hypothetical protein